MTVDERWSVFEIECKYFLSYYIVLNIFTPYHFAFLHRLLTILLLCDVNKPVAILCDNANMQMHIRKHISLSVIIFSQPKQIP